MTGHPWSSPRLADLPELPDLPELRELPELPEAAGSAGLTVSLFADGDAAELLVLQRCCWVAEALANDTLDIPPLHEDLDDVRRWGRQWLTLVVRLGSRLVGAVRARQVDRDWEVGRLMVAPDLAGQGLGRWLLQAVEQLSPAGTTRTTLFTGARSERNLRLYARAGYVVDDAAMASPRHVPGTVALTKPYDVPASAPSATAARPASSRATGTRNGEHDT